MISSFQEIYTNKVERAKEVWPTEWQQEDKIHWTVNYNPEQVKTGGYSSVLFVFLSFSLIFVCVLVSEKLESMMKRGEETRELNKTRLKRPKEQRGSSQLVIVRFWSLIKVKQSLLYVTVMLLVLCSCLQPGNEAHFTEWHFPTYTAENRKWTTYFSC